MNALVMDLGGTRLKAGVTAGGTLKQSTVADVPREGGRDDLLAFVRATGRDLIGNPEAVGLCVPGLVDDGTLVALPGKLAGLEGTDLGAFLRETFTAGAVAVTNDAIAFAIGEATAGAGRGTRRSVVVTIGTGVGVTVVEDGRPATSGVFGAGILGGFIPIAAGAGGALDTTGQAGTIEALCAAERIRGDAYASVPETFDAYSRGEEAARDAIEAYRDNLTHALVALAHAHAPDRLILGGGPMREGNPITPGLEELVNKRLYGTYRVEIRLSSLGDDASLIGLASLLGGSR